MSKKVINHIYLDLDGVLANFDFETVNELKSKGKWQNEGFPKFIRDKGFIKLPKLDDADFLLNFLKKSEVAVTILSSAGDPGDDYHEVVDQKLQWLRKHNIDFPALIVRKKDHKKQWARGRALLIDDNEKNCADFAEAGGNAIKHKSALNTIEVIKNNYFLTKSEK